ncbi:MAG: 1,4-dihydroxy-2-naphthoate polyprenyltransferase [Candidatus Nanopelagicales bacterium]
MASLGQWIQGARPRTLPAALAPVLVGTSVAYYYLAPSIHVAQQLAALLGDRSEALIFGAAEKIDGGVAALDAYRELGDLGASTTWGQFWVRAVLALVVALALQVGVNYANDYSDGIRGTDDVRVGPVRLVGQKLATPRAVKTAAFACFGVAAVCGLALVVITQAWWLLAVGAAAILAAWFYTGGTRPYGYAGLGELFVFVFFGLVAVIGTTYVQILRVSWLAIVGGVAVGALSVAILLCNNLRDIPTDELSGKRTLAVRLGEHGTRAAYSVAIATPFIALGGMAIGGVPKALVGLVALPLAIRPTRLVRGGAEGRDLIPALAGTGLLLLGYAVALSVGIAWSASA